VLFEYKTNESKKLDAEDISVQAGAVDVEPVVILYVKENDKVVWVGSKNTLFEFPEGIEKEIT
jgi:hypothetical protein